MKVVCGNPECWFILYEGNGFNGKKLLTPQDVIAQNEGKCPKCGRKLVYNAKNARFKELENAPKKRKCTP